MQKQIFFLNPLKMCRITTNTVNNVQKMKINVTHSYLCVLLYSLVQRYSDTHSVLGRLYCLCFLCYLETLRVCMSVCPHSFLIELTNRIPHMNSHTL